MLRGCVRGTGRWARVAYSVSIGHAQRAGWCEVKPAAATRLPEHPFAFLLAPCPPSFCFCLLLPVSASPELSSIDSGCFFLSRFRCESEPSLAAGCLSANKFLLLRCHPSCFSSLLAAPDLGLAGEQWSFCRGPNIAASWSSPQEQVPALAHTRRCRAGKPFTMSSAYCTDKSTSQRWSSWRLGDALRRTGVATREVPTEDR